MVSSILLKNINTLAVDLPEKKILQSANVYIEGSEIQEISSSKIVVEAERVVDCSSMVVMPGFINTHHHMYQTMQRAVPRMQDSKLFDWLINLYEIWREITPEAVKVSAKVAMAELMLTGCTTTSDQYYVFPEGKKGLLEAEIEAAGDMGVRFHPCRGSMSRGRSKGGLPPDDVVQDEDIILGETESTIRKYHDNSRNSMLQIVVSPCSPFSVTTELMEASAELARKYGVFLHTHLAETIDENKFCLDTHGMRPFDYMKEVSWVGPDVWFAHCVHLNNREIQEMADTGTGVAHCPTSNMRLGSGIAPVREMLNRGVNVSLAVDGSASNDSSNMVNELRMAMLLQRVSQGEDAFSPYEAIECGTIGGAKVLGRKDIGEMREGMAADIVGFSLKRLPFAGGLHDPVASVVLCGPVNVDISIINGNIRILDGNIVGLNMEELINHQNRLAKEMVTTAMERTGTEYLSHM
ncbi:MAG: 8-oxoguanine deaminase [Candidatus Thermoplasmatota archaeon]|jgi:cytosine/adenosine deaminase-related metal-dependent hydrolase|nr:8-oxoguanine deaminase [Candidatus Thermoplasmatota archaeon]